MAPTGRPSTRYITSIIEGAKKLIDFSPKRKKKASKKIVKGSPEEVVHSSTPVSHSSSNRCASDEEDGHVSSGESIRSIRSKSIAEAGAYKLGDDSDDEEIFMGARRGRVPPGKYKIGKQKSKLKFTIVDDARTWALLPDFFDSEVSLILLVRTLARF